MCVCEREILPALCSRAAQRRAKVTRVTRAARPYPARRLPTPGPRTLGGRSRQRRHVGAGPSTAGAPGAAARGVARYIGAGKGRDRDGGRRRRLLQPASLLCEGRGAAAAMSSAEQTVTWLITLGVLESPKKSIADPEGFLQASLKDGVVLCRLLDRLLPGTIDRVSPCAAPLPFVPRRHWRPGPGPGREGGGGPAWLRGLPGRGKGLSPRAAAQPLLARWLVLWGEGQLRGPGIPHLAPGPHDAAPVSIGLCGERVLFYLGLLFCTFSSPL